MTNTLHCGPARRGRPKTRDAAGLRQSIIDSACQAFTELGFAKTSTAEIARRAKISKRTLYEIFPDKKQLFAAVIGEHYYLLLDLPRPEGERCTPEAALFRIFRLDISEQEHQTRDVLLNLMIRESVLFPELSEYLYQTKAVRSRELLKEWLLHQPLQGGMTVEDIDVCTGMLMDIVFGALLPRRRDQDAETRQLRIAHIKQRIRITLAGMSALGASPSALSPE
ncbi:TetR/AcrR family transcriptional regulator [Tatumella ptyseos]|uniref:TetR/AcrR family transcriptional regulator n=1 Tax=Tatumella ptyseos TaxID=82987 RepID=UPI0023F41FD1|nr:TetR/AcrR family transcriptional regulator [Tatumella ptyseos]